MGFSTLFLAAAFCVPAMDTASAKSPVPPAPVFNAATNTGTINAYNWGTNNYIGYNGATYYNGQSPSSANNSGDTVMKNFGNWNAIGVSAASINSIGNFAKNEGDVSAINKGNCWYTTSDKTFDNTISISAATIAQKAGTGNFVYNKGDIKAINESNGCFDSGSHDNHIGINAGYVVAGSSNQASNFARISVKNVGTSDNISVVAGQVCDGWLNRAYNGSKIFSNNFGTSNNISVASGCIAGGNFNFASSIGKIQATNDGSNNTINISSGIVNVQTPASTTP